MTICSLCPKRNPWICLASARRDSGGVDDAVGGGGISRPGGRRSTIRRQVRLGIAEIGRAVVQFRNEFNSLEDIAQARLESITPGQSLRLGDIATIHRGTPEPAATLAMVDGRPSVVIGVMLRDEFRIDHWASAARPMLDLFAAGLPEGVRLDIVMEQDRFVRQRIDQLARNLLLGIAAVSVTTFLLLGWRSSLLVTATLPIASFMVLAGMRAFGIPIHQMSVTGLIIALGLLIDNAIIAADEVQISLRRGLAPMDAARDMVARLAAPLVASTLTTAFAFAPIGLMEGPAGEFVGSIAYTVMLAIFSSLFLALTILPAMAAWLQHRVTCQPPQTCQRFAWGRQIMRHGIALAWLTNGYRRALRWLLARPWYGVGLGSALPAAGFVAAARLSEQFFPPADRSQFHIEVELQPQASMLQTQSLIAQLDQALHQQPRIQQTAWFFGESAPAFYYNVISRFKNAPNFAQGIVNLDNNRDTGQLIRQLQSVLDVRFPEARILVRQLEQGPPFDAPVEVRIFGPDLDRLNELGEQIRLAATSIPSVIHTKTILSESRPMAEWWVRSQEAGWAGLTEQEIANQLFSRLEGLPAGSLIEQTEQVPVRVRMTGDRRGSFEALQDTGLITSHLLASAAATQRRTDNPSPLLTSLVPVSTVAATSLTPQRALISHYNGLRLNELKAYITAETLPSKALKSLQSELAARRFSLPPGYRLEYGGEASERNSAVSRLMANVSILAVGMLAAIVLALGSFRLAGLMAAVAVLAVGLGTGALWVFGYPFGFMAIIGTMGLIGIAINDSIVVVAALKSDAQARLGDQSAMVDKIVEVTRHVLATTATTMAGFAPLIMSGGTFWPPLAVAIGAGVMGASLIALTFVPCMMRLFYFPRGVPAAT